MRKSSRRWWRTARSTTRASSRSISFRSSPATTSRADSRARRCEVPDGGVAATVGRSGHAANAGEHRRIHRLRIDAYGFGEELRRAVFVPFRRTPADATVRERGDEAGVETHLVQNRNQLLVALEVFVRRVARQPEAFFRAVLELTTLPSEHGVGPAGPTILRLRLGHRLLPDVRRQEAEQESDRRQAERHPHRALPDLEAQRIARA